MILLTVFTALFFFTYYRLQSRVALLRFDCNITAVFYCSANTLLPHFYRTPLNHAFDHPKKRAFVTEFKIMKAPDAWHLLLYRFLNEGYTVKYLGINT